MTDEEMLAEIREHLDDIDEVSNKPGTCGACQHYNFKASYGDLDPTTGKCWGWREDDAYTDEDGHLIDLPRYVKSTDTCERYKENTAFLEEHKRNRPFTEQRYLASRKKRIEEMLKYRHPDNPSMSEEEYQEKINIFLEWLRKQ